MFPKCFGTMCTPSIVPGYTTYLRLAARTKLPTAVLQEGAKTSVQEPLLTEPAYFKLMFKGMDEIWEH